MDKTLVFIALLIIGHHTQRVTEAPLFFNLGNELEEVATSKTVFDFPNLDTTIRHEVDLLSDAHGQPLLFFSDIQTPVCIDGLCKPMYIQIYWNLLGSYAGYQAIETELLTKYDHEPFEEADYKKLHQLLSNPHSILDRKKMSDLYDDQATAEKQITYDGVEVDAVSGATKKEIKESVIEGALFSCYTIWHLVHGVVKEKIATHLDSIYSGELASSFLFSDYSDYQLHALKRLDNDGFQKNLNQISKIFQSAKPLTRTYILKKMPDDSWQNINFVQEFFRFFSSIDINSRTLLISKIPKSHPNAAILLSEQVAKMSRNQLRNYLSHLNPENIDEAIKDNFRKIIVQKSYQYSYLLETFLEQQ